MRAAADLVAVSERLRAGGIAVLAPVGRERVGNLIAAGAAVSPESINLMLHEGGGVLRAAFPPERARELGLEPQLRRRAAANGAADAGEAMLTLADAASGITTGISVMDRLRTIRVLADPSSTPDDLARPGHIVPVAAEPGCHRGAAEAASYMVRTLGLGEVAVLCHVLEADGSAMAPDGLRALASALGVPFLDPADLAHTAVGVPTAPPEIDPAEYRRVLGHHPTGVVVVTGGPAGRPEGMACNSFTSVSLEPPLVMFCPGKGSTSWPRMRPSGRFAINVLSDADEPMSRRFAARVGDRFASVTHRPSGLGNPLLERALAWIDCTIEAEHEAGDHWMVLGRVRSLSSREGRPLIFFRGRYCGCDERPAADCRAA